MQQLEILNLEDSGLIKENKIKSFLLFQYLESMQDRPLQSYWWLALGQHSVPAKQSPRDQCSQDHQSQEVRRKPFRLLYLSLTFCNRTSMFCHYILFLHKYSLWAPGLHSNGIFSKYIIQRCHACFKLLVDETTAGWEVWWTGKQSNGWIIFHVVSSSHSKVSALLKEG